VEEKAVRVDGVKASEGLLLLHPPPLILSILTQPGLQRQPSIAWLVLKHTRQPDSTRTHAAHQHTHAHTYTPHTHTQE